MPLQYNNSYLNKSHNNSVNCKDKKNVLTLFKKRVDRKQLYWVGFTSQFYIDYTNNSERLTARCLNEKLLKSD